MHSTFSNFSSMLTMSFLLTAASTRAESLCYDFAKKHEVTPLKEAPAPSGPQDSEQFGVKPDESTHWAALRGEVTAPLEKVLALFRQHEVLRDPSVNEVTVETLTPGPYLFRQSVRQVAKRFVFKVSWLEDWAASVTEGTPESPKTVVILYQKTEGTTHMQHYCASSVLRRTEQGTDVSLYQEGRITRRAGPAMLESMKLNLQRIRAEGASKSAQYVPTSGPSSATH